MQTFDALGKSGVTEPSKLLETFEAPPHLSYVKMKSDEVTAVCPVTGQPDQYTVTIQYAPRHRCIESKSLKLKLQSFRNLGAFGETLANVIATHVNSSIEPKDVRVSIVQKSRGGVEIESVVWIDNQGRSDE